jgi:FG-GAP repeat
VAASAAGGMNSLCNTAVVLERRAGPRIVSWPTLIVLVSLLFAATESFAAGENGTLRGDWSPLTIADGRAVNAPAFRLGNAARPFGWSTVVSDFNHDGIPDLAIADRAPRSKNGFRYEIEFAVSGRKPYDISFTSPLQAVTLQPDDVDGDRDIDIVVVDPISNDVVGVWLNDGDGHFAAADPRGFSRHPLGCRLDSWCSTEGIPAAFLRGQNQDSVSRRVDAQAGLPSREPLQRLSQSLPSIIHASSANPRAPPFSFQS